VYTADYQTAGRGRLDHKWISAPCENLMLSAVLDVSEIAIEEAATLPLVAGLAVANAVMQFIGECNAQLKWPNDVLVDGRKIAGILCERVGEKVIVGIGVNVRQTQFPSEIAARATSISILAGASSASVNDVRDAVLSEIARLYNAWRNGGFMAVYPDLRRIDFLRGKIVAVKQTDSDDEPARGTCGGIMSDGSLEIGGIRIYAGEAHVEEIR
jgi:BirA family biotin operon repressor/biotin-[acetyl-CoA-carboxylase] ligase